MLGGEIEIFNFAAEVKLGAARAVSAGPASSESAEVELRPSRHVGDLREEGVKRDADDGRAFG